MQFTPQELKQIEQLRKLERRWPKFRWMLLGVGVLFALDLLVSAYVLAMALREVASSDAVAALSVLTISVFFPKCLLYLCFATWAFTKVFYEWHGNAQRMLLLKLLDAQQDRVSQSAIAEPRLDRPNQNAR